MHVKRLEHYNIRTTKCDETIRFYVDVLGMKNEKPPGMPNVPPTWIYDDSGTAIIHLTVVDPADPEQSYAQRSGFRGAADKEDPPAFRGSGAIDHIAFECSAYDEMIEGYVDALHRVWELTVKEGTDEEPFAVSRTE